MKIPLDMLAALGRFRDCCEDPGAGGHDVPKPMMQALTIAGVLRNIGFGRHETTAFGDWVMAQPPPAVPASPVDRGAAVHVDDDGLRVAVGRLIQARGRYHTEQNYMALVDAYDAVMDPNKAPAK